MGESNEGWKCPECGRVNSPDTKTCECSITKSEKQGDYMRKA